MWRKWRRTGFRGCPDHALPPQLRAVVLRPSSLSLQLGGQRVARLRASERSFNKRKGQRTWLGKTQPRSLEDVLRSSADESVFAFSQLGQSICSLQPEGGEVYFGAWIQPMVHRVRGRGQLCVSRWIVAVREAGTAGGAAPSRHVPSPCTPSDRALSPAAQEPELNCASTDENAPLSSPSGALPGDARL